MKKFMVFAALSFFVAPLVAQAKPCDELKSEIAAKLQAKGVKDPDSRLNIVATEDVKDQKVVGSCEAGKKKIVYDQHGGHADDDHHPADDHGPAH